MEKPLLEYIKLLDKRPDVIAKVMIDHVRIYDLSDDEQLGIVELWLKNSQLAESLLFTYSEGRYSCCDAALLKFLEFWKNGSISAENFLKKYTDMHGLGNKVVEELIKIDKDGTLLVPYSKKYKFSESVQTTLVELIPNNLAITLLKEQHSYTKDTLLKLLDLWKQYPGEIAGIIENEGALRCIFSYPEILLKLTSLLETMPEATKETFGVKEIFEEYMHYDDLSSSLGGEVLLAFLEHIEKGSPKASSVAKEIMVLFTKRIFIFEKHVVQKLMELFKANPTEVYDIVLQIVKRPHSTAIETELVDLWLAGSKEAYNMLLATEDCAKSVDTRIFKLWRQGIPGAYEILSARGINLFLEDEGQVELVDLMGNGSEEAYNLLYGHTHYPGHKLCPEALMKLSLYKTSQADEIIKRAMRRSIQD